MIGKKISKAEIGLTALAVIVAVTIVVLLTNNKSDKAVNSNSKIMKECSFEIPKTWGQGYMDGDNKLIFNIGDDENNGTFMCLVNNNEINNSIIQKEDELRELTSDIHTSNSEIDINGIKADRSRVSTELQGTDIVSDTVNFSTEDYNYTFCITLFNDKKDIYSKEFEKIIKSINIKH